jgi:CheY-like chemotaxis protein
MNELMQWKIVLVDDEPDSLNLVAEMLILNGAEVYRAPGGEQCLNLLESIMPTVVVCDLAMPRPDGWDVLAAIRARPNISRVPVVAITAYYSEKVADEARRAGFDAFCPKPIKANDFLRLLKSLVA